MQDAKSNFLCVWNFSDLKKKKKKGNKMPTFQEYISGMLETRYLTLEIGFKSSSYNKGLFWAMDDG